MMNDENENVQFKTKFFNLKPTTCLIYQTTQNSINKKILKYAYIIIIIFLLILYLFLPYICFKLNLKYYFYLVIRRLSRKLGEPCLLGMEGERERDALRLELLVEVEL